MARYLTLLTLALVTATQTAQAFPSIIDNTRSFRPSHAESRIIVALPSNEMLLMLEVAAEEDPALADAFESVLEMHLDDDATLEVMLVLIAMEERGVGGEAFNQDDGSRMTLETPSGVWLDGCWVEFPGDVMMNQVGIEAKKRASRLGCRFPPHN